MVQAISKYICYVVEKIMHNYITHFSCFRWRGEHFSQGETGLGLACSAQLRGAEEGQTEFGSF